MNITQERIKEAIKNSGLSYRELAEKIGISSTSIYRYVQKSVDKIPLFVVEKIADVTNTDVKWLMGWDDMLDNEYRKIFAKNLNRYMQINGKTQADLIKDLKYSSSTISNWCTGQKIPRMDKIEQLATYFGINKSDLIENKTEKPVSSQKQAIIDKIINMDDDMLNRWIQILHVLELLETQQEQDKD